MREARNLMISFPMQFKILGQYLPVENLKIDWCIAVSNTERFFVLQSFETTFHDGDRVTISLVQWCEFNRNSSHALEVIVVI